MDRLESMAVFVRAADTGSFTAASRLLGMSPQMVGKHVTFLEERLGTRLLNRTTRRQGLTEFGQTYYECCKRVLAEAEAADSLAQEVGATPRGRLRINAPVTFGTYGLVPLITRYQRSHPQVQVDLILTDRLVDILAEGYEVVIRLGPLANSSLKVRPLAPYRLVACASPRYLARHGVPTTPEELADHECLRFTSWPRSLADEWRFTRDERVHRVKTRSRLMINDWKAVHAAALHDAGVILGAEAALAGDLESGRLVRVLPDYEAPSRPMHILFSADPHPTAKVRSFVNAVIAEFGPRRTGRATGP